MIAIESPLAAALNHLLRAEPWARERLMPFAGQSCELRLPPLPAVRLRVTGEGMLAADTAQEVAALVVTLGPEALPALARGEDHFLRALEVAGNAHLANEFMFLLRHLRWDAEEDLARVVGDAPAHRLARGARAFFAMQREALERVAAGFMEYALEEQPLLARGSDLRRHAREVATLRDALERLDQRLERLGG